MVAIKLKTASMGTPSQSTIISAGNQNLERTREGKQDPHIPPPILVPEVQGQEELVSDLRPPT